MKIGFYPKMAWMGIEKNRKLYIPYMLACAGMVMMCYLISFLSVSETILGIPGGDTMQTMLSMGIRVMSVFAAIFLFYTNSFLVRRRTREFGLYNILGMGKWNLVRILIWESLITAAFSLGGGLFSGILFSKLAELGMIHVLGGEVDFSFGVSLFSAAGTVKLFAVIFLIILLNSVRKVHMSRPVELLQSEAAGEKAPKANWLPALLGLVILGAAYAIAVSISEPVAAMMWFFIAVLMVIAATYLLFLAGSVALCRLLQKKKSYYYKTKHFVSISSMAYRMKRNGAGLASICILSTMVLVMLSSTTCLFVGAEASLRTRYPRNIVVNLGSTQEEAVAKTREAVGQVLSANGAEAENLLEYKILETAACIDGEKIVFNDPGMYSFNPSSASAVRQLFFIPLSDYNRMMGQEETLAENEVLVYTTKSELKAQELVIEYYETLKIKKYVPEFVDNGVDAMQVIPSVFIFVPDFERVKAAFAGLADFAGDRLARDYYHYGFDLDCSDEGQIKIETEIQEAIRSLSLADETFPETTHCEGVASVRAGFYGLYGGLFFLGILLSVVFLAATVLIVYYKQISEGFEDAPRFEIMQKVGMTKREIKKSINSQILTVFLAPLFMAGLHLAFAFPMVSKLLLLFGLKDKNLLIMVTVASYLIFGVFYAAVYRVTSRVYYRIVSRND